MRDIWSGLLCIFVIFPVLPGPGCSGKVGGVSGQDGEVGPDGGDAAVDPDSTASDDNAEFVSQNVPASVAPGAGFQAEFTMRNTGETTWGEADGYRLGSWNPQDNDTWSTGRIEIQGATTVAPNDTYLFTANLTAPATPGSYTMQWRMVHEFAAWFGDPTAELTIQVEDTCFDHCNNQQMDCGETYIDCGGTDCAACQPIELATQDASGSYPRVAVAAYDRVMVVWHRNASNADSQIHWDCFDGNGWSGPAPMTQVNGHAGYPWLVADAQQRFHVVYSHGLGDNRYTHYNRYDGADCAGQWHNTAEVLPRHLPFSVTYPSVDVDQNDRPLVTFSQSLAAKPPSYPACANTAACAADYHCWPYDGPGECHPDYAQYYTRRTSGTFGNGNWIAPGVIAVGLAGHVSHHGTVFVQGSNLAHAVWLQVYPGHEIYYSQYNGSGWSNPEFTGISGCHAADVQADAQDVFVFSNSARFVSRPVSSPGNWSSAVNVGSGGFEINLIRLRIDQSGRLHAVWTGSGYRIMYAMTDANGDWLAQKPVSPAGEECHQPSIDVDSDGNAHIVWAQCTSTAPCSGEFGSVWYLKTRYDELP